MAGSRIFAILTLGLTCVTVLGQSSPTRLPSAGERKVPLNAKLCVDATDAQKKGLPESWSRFQGIIACPLNTGKGRALLYVLSVDGEKFAASIKQGEIVPALPQAWIILPDGTHIGTLPYAFPFDPPVSLDITFTNWNNNWPGALKLYVEDPTVSGNHPLPSLRWDSKGKRFVTTGDTHGDREKPRQ
jgi:hypothetical protein